MSHTGNSNAVLAIDPGTREMGIAVFDGKNLELATVFTMKDQLSPGAVLREARIKIRKLIRLYEPKTLAIEKTFVRYGSRSSLLIVLSREIVLLAKLYNLKIVEVSAKAVKKHVTGDAHAEKRDVALAVCRIYPDLRIHLKQTHQYKEKYWYNMFDAVAVGLTATGKD